MERYVVFTTLVFCTALFLFTPAVHAWQTYDPAVYQGLANQELRINRGISCGRLTPYETARFWDINARIRHEDMLMKSYGRLTGRERLQLHHDFNHSSRAIYRMKHSSPFAY